MSVHSDSAKSQKMIGAKLAIGLLNLSATQKKIWGNVTMSKFDDERAAKLRKQYNMPEGKLQVEKGRNFPKLVEDKPNDKHYASYIRGLKNKFQMDGLELEGQDAFKPKEDDSFFEKAERAEVKDLKLAIGSTTFRGKKLHIWYLKSK
jgi:hypothetical protein